MRPTPNSIRRISTTPWKAPATPPKKPKLPRKTSPRPPSGERNERREANGSSAAVELGDGFGAADQTHPSEETYPQEIEATGGTAPSEFSSPRRRSSFSARLHTARL